MVRNLNGRCSMWSSHLLITELLCLERKYGMKHKVETIGSGRTRYSVKLWPYDQPEPEQWDFEGIEEDENLTSGSALLIAHNTSVTFGDVVVEPIINY